MSDRLTVVFDLDETLIHGSQSIPSEWADFMSGPYRCMIRPHALDLIEECLGKYNVGIWTSAGVHHAASVVEALFDDPELLHFVWSAERCTDWRDFELNEMVSIKDLRKLKRLGHDLNRIVAIDDSPEKHQRNFGNLLRVRPWTGEQEDTELLDVAKYLNWLSTQPSVRSVEKRGWRNQTHWR
jgi:carboxy-terminal domain RNA polymerase II polypeptide A small phosphatase